MRPTMDTAMTPTGQPKLSAVVFDLDGLIFNTEELYEDVGGELLARRGRRMTADLLDQMMGRKTPVALEIMINRHGLDDSVESLARESEAIFAKILDERLETMPGLLELLAALDEALIPKAIATSSQRSFAEDVLGRFNLVPHFRFILTAEDIDNGKPHPEIYLRAARQLELDTAEVLVLEDSENGCRAAVAAGTCAVAVPHGRSRSHDFSGALFVAETLADPRIYQALGLKAGFRV